MYDNYGDVALNLPADFDRNKLANRNSALTLVGHKDGVSDVYRTDDPRLQHNFRWVDPRNQTDLDRNRSTGFRFVTKAEWTKNEDLWDWDAEGFLYGFGQRLMARSKERYLQEQEELEAERHRELRNKDEEIVDRGTAEVTVKSGRKVVDRRRQR